MKQPTYLNHTDMAALQRPDLNVEHLDEAQRNACWEIDLLMGCVDESETDSEGHLISEMLADSDEIKSLPGMQENWL